MEQRLFRGQRDPGRQSPAVLHGTALQPAPTALCNQNTQDFHCADVFFRHFAIEGERGLGSELLDWFFWCVVFCLFWFLFGFLFCFWFGVFFSFLGLTFFVWGFFWGGRSFFNVLQVL